MSATPYDDTSYAYDAAGNIASQADTRNGSASETQCFTYDMLSRLAAAWTATGNCAAPPSAGAGGNVGDGIAGGAYWTSWSYDPLGDQQVQTQHSVTGGTSTVTNYTYNDGNGTASGQPNTLTSTSATGPAAPASTAYAYDAAGNTLTRNTGSGNQTLTWYDDGKLETDTTSGGTTTYIYDADGNLLLREDPAAATLLVFGEQLVLSGGAVTGTRFIPLPGGGTAVRTGAGSSYSFEATDRHGTGVLALDAAAANPQWRQFTPFGAPRGTPPASWPDADGYLGAPADAGAGLTTLGARDYDPAAGRFISIDPVLEQDSPQQLGGYAYAAGNPVTDADPTGLLLPAEGGTCEYYEVGCQSAADSNPPLNLGQAGEGFLSFAYSQAVAAVAVAAFPVAGPAGIVLAEHVKNPFRNPDPGNPSYRLGEGIAAGASFLIPGDDEATLAELGAGGLQDVTAGAGKTGISDTTRTAPEAVTGTSGPASSLRTVAILGPKEFDPASLRGLTPAEVRASIPSDWVSAASPGVGTSSATLPTSVGKSGSCLVIQRGRDLI